MYQVTVKGKNLAELKKAVSDLDGELNGNVVTIVNGTEKDLSLKDIDKVINPPAVLDVSSNTVTIPAHAAPVESPVIAEAPAFEIKCPVNVDSSLELDNQGIPHDIRIHASSKAKVATGSWRSKRGVDKDLLAQVVAELKAAYSGSPVVEAPAPLVTQPAEPIVPVVAPPVVEAPTPIAPPVLNVSSGHSVETFKKNFVMIIASLITEGKIAQDYINQLKAHFGVDELWNFDEAQQEEIFASFVSFGFIQKV